MKRRLQLAFVATMLLAACSSQTPEAASPPAAAYRVLVGSGAFRAGGVEVLTTADRRLSALPSGTLSRDSRHLYSIEPGAATPSLRVLDTVSGGVLRARAISSSAFAGPGILSADGHWLVESYIDSGVRIQTHLALFDTSTLGERDIVLEGVFGLDAINDSATLLYLLESVGTGQYRVRDYDLAAGSLDATVIVDKTDASPVMSGTRVATVATADGRKVFGLYQRSGRPPFIHALWTDEKLAWCVDLPATGGADGGPGWSLVLDESRARLYAVNSSGVASEVDYSNIPQVLRTRSYSPPPVGAFRLPLIKDAYAKGYEAPGGGGASLSAEGGTIFVPDSSGVVAVTRAALEPRSRLLAGHDVTSVAVSPDGRVLFAVEPRSNSLFELDARSGRLLATFSVPYPVSILAIAAA